MHGSKHPEPSKTPHQHTFTQHSTQLKKVKLGWPTPKDFPLL